MGEDYISYELTDKGLKLKAKGELAREAVRALYESPYSFRRVNVSMTNPDNLNEVEIEVPGTADDHLEALKTLYREELIECNHEIVERVPVDDTVWLGMDAEIHTKSNPDILHCKICGKIYNQRMDEWEA